MEGNCAYLNQLGAMMFLNDIYVLGGFTPELLKFFQCETPVRIPKPYADAPDKPYYIPHMEMSPGLYQKIMGSEARSISQKHRHADGRRAKTRPRVFRRKEACCQSYTTGRLSMEAGCSNGCCERMVIAVRKRGEYQQTTGSRKALLR
jgi:hypothetical protein